MEPCRDLPLVIPAYVGQLIPAGKFPDGIELFSESSRTLLPDFVTSGPMAEPSGFNANRCFPSSDQLLEICFRDSFRFAVDLKLRVNILDMCFSSLLRDEELL